MEFVLERVNAQITCSEDRRSTLSSLYSDPHSRCSTSKVTLFFGSYSPMPSYSQRGASWPTTSQDFATTNPPASCLKAWTTLPPHCVFVGLNLSSPRLVVCGPPMEVPSQVSSREERAYLLHNTLTL